MLKMIVNKVFPSWVPEIQDSISKSDSNWRLCVLLRSTTNKRWALSSVLIIMEWFCHSKSFLCYKHSGNIVTARVFRTQKQTGRSCLNPFTHLLRHINTFTGNMESRKGTTDLKSVLKLVYSHTPLLHSEALQKEKGKHWASFQTWCKLLSQSVNHPVLLTPSYMVQSLKNRSAAVVACLPAGYWTALSAVRKDWVELQSLLWEAQRCSWSQRDWTLLQSWRKPH